MAVMGSYLAERVLGGLQAIQTTLSNHRQPRSVLAFVYLQG